MDGTQEYDGGITVELKDTQEFGESKITKRIFDVSMEQVMVANYACAIAAPNMLTRICFTRTHAH